MPAFKDNSFFNWLGRQIGHVSKAVKEEPPPAVPAPKVVFRNDKVEEMPHPEQPGVVLRRTTIDEVIVEKPTTLPGPGADGSSKSEPV